MILDFFIDNSVVLWTLVIIITPWIPIGVIAFFIIRKVAKRIKRKTTINQVMNEMDFLEVELQAHETDSNNAPTKNNVITFPNTSE